MADDQASLRDLVETCAARHGLAQRLLWKWALDAIVRNELVPIFSDGSSLDTKLEHSGRLLSWREIINIVLPSTDRNVPTNEFWANNLIFAAAGFDNWAANAIKRSGAPVHPKRPAGAKRKTPRDELASFIHATYGLPLSGSITYNKIATDFEAKTGVYVKERTVARALGRK